MTYTWIDAADAATQLSLRLADPGMVFWTAGELQWYLSESLRTWNALTATWKTTFAFGLAAASSPTWFSLGSLAQSPRLRTLTDAAVYTAMEYHLLEPATGALWSGTSQFTIADLSLALQRCRDEAIQVANSNQAIIRVPAQPNVRKIALPDNVLDVGRVRWISNGTDTSAPVMVTLTRNDDTGLDNYQPDYLQATAGTPAQYVIAALAPLTLHVDVAPADEGNFEILALLAGSAITPPTPAPLLVPDDFMSVLKWGALADLLSRESEATDLPRATYCRKRYTDGLKLLASTPWVTQARINGVTATLTDFSSMDSYSPEWDSQAPDMQTVILGGVDFFNVVPDPNNPMSVELRVLANAPVPLQPTDFIQCSRDAWDVVLDYAQFLAAFKQGGAEFQAALPLEQGFYAAAMAANDRLQKLGIFADVMQQQATKELRAQPRYSAER